MEFIERIKRDVRFNNEEVKRIILVSLILGFVIALSKLTILSLIGGVLVVLLSVFFKLFVQKIVAVQKGIKIEFKVWWYGVIAALVIGLITQGKFWWIIVPGGFFASMIAKYRMGKFRFGLNFGDIAVVSLWGPVASIILGSIFMNIYLYTPLKFPIFESIFIWNLVYAVWSLLPIPPLDGHHTFFGGRATYAFTTGLIATYCLLILILGIYSWIWALIGGVLVWAIYLFKFEIKTF